VKHIRFLISHFAGQKKKHKNSLRLEKKLDPFAQLELNWCFRSFCFRITYLLCFLPLLARYNLLRWQREEKNVNNLSNFPLLISRQSRQMICYEKKNITIIFSKHEKTRFRDGRQVMRLRQRPSKSLVNESGKTVQLFCGSGSRGTKIRLSYRITGLTKFVLN
jgi:hypothetical protein